MTSWSWTEAAHAGARWQSEQDERRRQRAEREAAERAAVPARHAKLMTRADCATLRGVIQLHAPSFVVDGSAVAECDGCQRGDECGMQEWPCPTVELIEERLG